MYCAESANAQLEETVTPGAVVKDGFIYVYDMPAEFTKDLSRLPVQWHPTQYDYDQARMAACSAPLTRSTLLFKMSSQVRCRTYCLGSEARPCRL